MLSILSETCDWVAVLSDTFSVFTVDDDFVAMDDASPVWRESLILNE